MLHYYVDNQLTEDDTIVSELDNPNTEDFEKIKIFKHEYGVPPLSYSRIQRFASFTDITSNK